MTYLNIRMSHCTVLYCTVSYCTVLYYTVLNCTVLYCTVRYYTVLYCTVLCVTVLCVTVLCVTVLHIIRKDSTDCGSKDEFLFLFLLCACVFVWCGSVIRAYNMIIILMQFVFSFISRSISNIVYLYVLFY